MKYPSKWKARNLSYHYMNSDCSVKIADGNWVPARPEGAPSFWWRFKLAWLVWTGRADAVIWEGQ